MNIEEIRETTRLAMEMKAQKIIDGLPLQVDQASGDGFAFVNLTFITDQQINFSISRLRKLYPEFRIEQHGLNCKFSCG